MTNSHADLVVLGGGPGGYAAAFRAADLGREVTLVDPRVSLGGVCLNEGCIPSKALLHVASVIREASEIASWGVLLGAPSIEIDALRNKKAEILDRLTNGLEEVARRRRVNLVRGSGKFSAGNAIEIDGAKWTFNQAVIAVGSRPISLPGWPGDERIWNSTDALDLRRIPDRMVIVGGGIIGVEMATVYSTFGSQVTVVELAPQIIPEAESVAARLLQAELEKQGVTILTGTSVERVEADEAHMLVHCCGQSGEKLETDVVLQAVGRRANGDLIGADAAGIKVRENGVIDVDRQCRTNQGHIFAIGDVTGAPMLAHRATHQGKVAAETACGKNAELVNTVIPSVAYTSPELAWVGTTPDCAKAIGIDVRTTRFPWLASGRNLASGGRVGQTEIVYEPDSMRVIGATLIGSNAGELLAELVLAIEMGATLEDLALTVHAHPTLSETTAFAAERALGTLTDL